MTEIIHSGCLVIGVLFIALGSFSLIRLPTFFARLRAFILLMTVGMFFIIIGIIVSLGYELSSLASIKLWIICGIQVITIPLIGHLIGRVRFYKEPSCQSSDVSD